MPRVIDRYPCTWTALFAASILPAPTAMLVGCSSSIKAALLGLCYYGSWTGVGIGLLPVRKMGCGRLIQILTGAAFASGSLYKISGLFPSNSDGSVSTAEVLAVSGSFAGSLIFPFAQEIYQLGKIVCGRNRDQVVVLDPNQDSDSLEASYSSLEDP